LVFNNEDPLFQVCRHCTGKIIVPSSVAHEMELQKEKPAEYAMEERTNLKLAEIQSELRNGRKINAIALFREAYGTNLQTAKAAVESIQLGKIPETFEKVPTTPQTQRNTAVVKNTQNQSNPAKLIWNLIQLFIFAVFMYWFFG